MFSVPEIEVNVQRAKKKKNKKQMMSSMQLRNWKQVRYYVRSVSASLGWGCSYKPRRKFKEIERSGKRERERTSFENFCMFHIGCYIVLRCRFTTFLGVIPNLQIRKLSFRERPKNSLISRLHI